MGAQAVAGLGRATALRLKAVFPHVMPLHYAALLAIETMLVSCEVVAPPASRPYALMVGRPGCESPPRSGFAAAPPADSLAWQAAMAWQRAGPAATLHEAVMVSCSPLVSASAF